MKTLHYAVVRNDTDELVYCSAVKPIKIDDSTYRVVEFEKCLPGDVMARYINRQAYRVSDLREGGNENKN